MDVNIIICLQAWVPMRKTATSTSEMISSLLFGETAQVLQIVMDWYYIKMHYDEYEGWVGKEYVHAIDSVFPSKIVTDKDGYYSNKLGKIKLPAGAQTSPEVLNLLGLNWELFTTPEIENSNIAASAIYHFLHVPYLWGGRSNCGIDCSGLVQIVLKMAGLSCARDAWQQELLGENIVFGQHTVNDIAFFSKNNKVTHVGILINAETIIHASGMVRIDGFNKQGIIHSKTEICTHTLHSIKRIL